MSSRLLATAFRLLSPVVNQSPDNPIQLDRLPLNFEKSVEFDYPVYQESFQSARRRAFMWVFLMSLVAPVLTWWSYLLPIPYVQGGLRVIALLIGAALVVLGVLGPHWPSVAASVALLTVLLLASMGTDLPYTLSALLPVIAGLIFLSARLSTFYIYLRTAAPVPKDDAAKIRRLWKNRFLPLRPKLPGSENYSLVFLLPIAGGAAMINELSKHPEDISFFTTSRLFLYITGSCLLFPWVFDKAMAPVYKRKSFSLRALFGAFIRALSEWCSYNRLNTRGAGIHRSRVGTAGWRKTLLAGVVLVTCCLWTGIAPRTTAENAIQNMLNNPWQAFFNQWQQEEIVNSVLGDLERDWQQKYGGPPERVASVQHNIGPEYDPNWKELTQEEREANERAATERWVIDNLSEAEKQMLGRLEGEGRDEYLRLREAQISQRNLDSHKEAARRRETKKPAELISSFFSKVANATVNLLVPALSAAGLALSAVFAMTARSLAGIEALCGSEERTRILSPRNWHLLVERLRSSADKVEKKSILVGTLAQDDTPVLVPRDVFKEHAHILGDSGAGKTSIGLAPLISQLMRFGDSSVVILDLKADDQALFQNTRVEAEALTKRMRRRNHKHPGYRFRWFTSACDKSTYAFNPLQQIGYQKLSLDQRTDFISAALGLNYGTEYGRKYFGDSNFDVLYYALQSRPDISSFGQLADVLKHIKQFGIDAETKKAASHIGSAVRRLARLPSLNVISQSATDASVVRDSIDCSQLFEIPQAVYLALPPSAGVSTTAEIARLFLYSLLNAAQLHHGRTRKQVYLVIDEFQRIVSGNLALFLQTARSMGIGVILSNQSLADLDAVDVSLISATRTNTRFRQVFGVGEPQDIEDLQLTAGETVVGLRSFGYTPSLFGTAHLDRLSVSETPSPRLSRTDILLATDKPGQSIASIRRGLGYAQFGGMHFRMDSVHHISPRTFKNRKIWGWPEHIEGTLVTAAAPTAEPVQPDDELVGAFPTLGEQPATVYQEAEQAAEADDAERQLLEAYDRQREAKKPKRGSRKGTKRPRKLPPDSAPPSGGPLL